jgi:hypothetical protein
MLYQAPLDISPPPLQPSVSEMLGGSLHGVESMSLNLNSLSSGLSPLSNEFIYRGPSSSLLNGSLGAAVTSPVMPGSGAAGMLPTIGVQSPVPAQVQTPQFSHGMSALVTSPNEVALAKPIFLSYQDLVNATNSFAHALSKSTGVMSPSDSAGVEKYRGSLQGRPVIVEVLSSSSSASSSSSSSAGAEKADKSRDKGAQNDRGFLRELAVLTDVSHVNILPLVAYSLRPPARVYGLSIVEWADIDSLKTGDVDMTLRSQASCLRLADVLKTDFLRRHLSGIARLRLASSVFRVVRYLHSGDWTGPSDRLGVAHG